MKIISFHLSKDKEYEFELSIIFLKYYLTKNNEKN